MPRESPIGYHLNPWRQAFCIRLIAIACPRITLSGPIGLAVHRRSPAKVPARPVDKASRSALRYILRLVMAVEYWKIEISQRRDNVIAL